MHARLIALISLAIAATAAPALAESAAELYYERAVMSAADARCALFTPEISFALSAATVQARNAALRGGTAASTLDAASARARTRAAAAACNGADVRTAAGRVRQAFNAYASLGAMNFPGDLGDWRALRGQNVSNSQWRLWQAAGAGQDRMTFGVAGKNGQDFVTAVGAFADGQTPYAARLVMRDPGRAPSPYIANLAGAAPLYARLPPASAERTILADARSPAEVALKPPGAVQATAFRFPASSLAALDALDPREAIGIDFVFAGPAGDQVRRAYFEVGDFAAGVAFLGAAAK